MENQTPLHPRQLRQQPRHLPSLSHSQIKPRNFSSRKPHGLSPRIKPPILTEHKPMPITEPRRNMTESRISQKLLTRKAHPAFTGTPATDRGLIDASDRPNFFIGEHPQQFRLINAGSVDEIAEPLGTDEGMRNGDMRKQLGELLFSGYASRDFFLAMVGPRER